MLFENKDLRISELHDEYIEKRQMGQKPEVEVFLKRCPFRYRQELREDLQDWEWLVGWKFDGSAEEIDGSKICAVIEKIQDEIG